LYLIPAFSGIKGPDVPIISITVSASFLSSS
jgi:hypothetical protein